MRSYSRIPLGIFPLCLTAFAFLCTLADVSFAQIPANVVCDKCHADQEFLIGKADSPQEEAALHVPTDMFLGTSHDTVACVECHQRYGDSYPHGIEVTSVACESCHEDAGVDWAQSTHAANREDADDAPDCMECHGIHVVYDSDNRLSPTHPLNAVAQCADCHTDSTIIATYYDEPDDSLARVAVEHFWEGAHGRGLSKAGLVSSATCSSCHHPHRVLPADSANSTLHRGNVIATCGECHLGVLETFMPSAHGVALVDSVETDGGDPAPVCTDCHVRHQVENPREESWHLAVVTECGTCHQSLYDSYRGTYHGKGSQLGYGRTARCSDCHNAHGIRAPDDTLSSVHPMNLVATCGQCHTKVSEKFVEYYSHGDFTNREEYPYMYWPWVFMTTLLVGTFGVFGTHSVFWFARDLYDRLRSNPVEPEETEE
jgi:hypothetical protein